MAKNDQLFFLIQSLNQSEKRYFKMFCFSQKVDNNYLKLFELISKQDNYDEEKVRKKFAGERFLKQLHVTKNYLYHLILKSLRSYHAKISTDAELKAILRNVEILYTKELYKNCHSELQRAEKLATKFEKLAPLLEIINWKRKLQLLKSGSANELLTELIEAEKNVLKELSIFNEHWQMTTNIFQLYQDEKDLLTAPPGGLRERLIDDPQPGNTLQSKVMYYHLCYVYYVMNEEPQNALASLNQLIEIIKQHPERIQDDPSSYIRILLNKLSFYIFQKQYANVPSLLNQIRRVPETYQLKNANRIALKLWLRTYNVELEMLRDTKAFKKGVQLIEEIETFMVANEKLIPADYWLMLRYQFACIYFMEKDFSSSLKWVNEIINTPYKKERIDLQSFARLLNLMIHFELGNIIVLKYAVENCRRFLKKEKRIEPFEKVLLRFFSKICNAPYAEYHTHFQRLKKELLETDPPIVNENILDYLDLKSWLENKLEKKDERGSQIR